MEKLDKIIVEPKAAFFDVSKANPLTDQPLSFDALKSQINHVQTGWKSFEQWQLAKRECEAAEDWEKIKAGIEAAPNLSRKQKDLLIKYS